MSRSRRRTPIVPITCTESEKNFKRFESRRRRACERAGREYIPASWGPKDGRQYIERNSPWYAKAMRK